MTTRIIKAVAWKELLETWRDGRVRCGFGIAMALLLFSLLLGWQNWRETAAQRAAASEHDRQVWLNQGPENPHLAAHFGRYLFKPVSPLALIEPGLDDFLGNTIRIEAHRQTPARYRPSDDATVISRFGQFTVPSVMQLFVPLLLILLLFPAFAGEREGGTLRQVLSLGVVTRGSVAWGKIAAGAVVLPVLIVPAAAAGVLVLFVNSSPSFADSLLRLLLLAAGYLIYFSVIAFLCLAVSAAARSARVALAGLLTFWTVSLLIVPRLASDIADRCYPVPSMQAFLANARRDMSAGLNGHDPADRRFDALRERLLAQYKVAKIEDLPVNFDAIALQAAEEYGNQILDKHYGNLWRQYERQASVQQLFSFLSPLIALRRYSMGLAGTDLAAHRIFAERAEVFRRELVSFLNGYMATHSRTDSWNWKASETLWTAAPVFHFEPAPLARRLHALAIEGLVLLAWLGGTVLFVLYTVNRMRPEA